MTLHAVRRITNNDPETISSAFIQVGWDKPITLFTTYLDEQRSGLREVFLAEVRGQIAGYITLCWKSEYQPFSENNIPEVKDLNVLPEFRKRGIATYLLDHVEKLASKKCSTIGIGVGLYTDYGKAQRLYVIRGYVPDGRGVAYNNQTISPMETIQNDDDLNLFLTKDISGL